MRILHVVPTYLPAVRYGGPIRSVHGLATALVRRGHSVDVYTTNMDGPSDLAVAVGEPVDLDGVRIHYFPVPAARRLAWSPALARALANHVASFDVVHLHSVFLFPTFAAARAARRAGVPFVASPRGMLMRGAINDGNALLKRLWIAAVERRTYRDAAAVHVTAALEAEDLRQAGVDPRRISVIENGLDLPRSPGTLAAGPFASVPKPYALFLSRISSKKGLDRLIRAWRDVRDLTLVVAGNDEDGYRRQMEKLATSEGLAYRIAFVGAASDADKWALYAGAAMFVLPSYAENFGNVVVEAMAMRCPVIVSDAVGAAGLVRRA
jgi:glycosyltransferase involved in cell wall biosynthesis